MTVTSLYVSEKEVAQLLGQSISWLRSNAHMLEASTNFPKIDPVIRKRHREAIEVWARERNFRHTPGRDRLNSERNQENRSAF